jgi:hypothetical protein
VTLKRLQTLRDLYRIERGSFQELIAGIPINSMPLSSA